MSIGVFHSTFLTATTPVIMAAATSTPYWISGCYFENGGSMPYRIAGNQIELSVENNCISFFPDATAVCKVLMEIHTDHIFCGFHFIISDTITILDSGMTIPLGPLTIYFGDKDPCPALTWEGEKCDDFHTLNKGFARYMKLKSFW